MQDDVSATRTKLRLSSTALALAFVTACFCAGSCDPQSKVFGGTITGTVLDSSAQPVGLVTVYVLDAARGEKAGNVDALSGANGHFRLDAPAGTWTLVATNFQGAAAFLYDVRIRNGQVSDIGAVYLQPCAEPGSGSNNDVYEECPDAEAEDQGYGAPMGPLGVETFVPSYTDAALSDGSPGTDVLEITSYSDSQSVRLDIQVPETSPYFTVGDHLVAGDSPDFFATLYDLSSGVIYVLRSGTFTVEALEPEEGGTFRARLGDAIFDWYDFGSGLEDENYTATLGATSPAMTDSITVTPANGPSGSTPPQSYHFDQLEPEFTQVYVAGDGTVQVVTYDIFAEGDYVQLILDVPPAMNAPGSFAIQNTIGQDPGAWDFELHATALYADPLGYEYGYVLESATWTVSDAASGAGDTFAASLDGATFQWQADPGSPPFSTLTLTLGSSGTMSGTADPLLDDGDSGSGRLDWRVLKTDLTVQLGD